MPTIPQESIVNVKPTGFWKRLWYKETGVIARILCISNLHQWRYNVDGYTNDEFKTCGRCFKYGGPWPRRK